MNSTFRKACVTGGAGFIGSRLVKALLSRGIETTVVDDLSVGRVENIPSGAQFVRSDILATERVREALDSCQVVFHLAARVAIRSSFEFVVADTMTNVSGTASVLRAAQLAGSVQKFVFTSSMAVYADSPGKPVTEDFLIVPISPYGISKLAAEKLTHQMCSQAGIDSVVLRLFNTYGVGQRLSPYVGAITIFCDKLANGEAPRIFGDGEQKRDFVHIDDVVQGLLRGMESCVTRETFNIGSGTGTTVNQVVRRLEATVNLDIPPVYVDAVPGELKFSVADITKAKQMLQYQPQHSFEDSIAEVAKELVASSTLACAAKV